MEERREAHVAAHEEDAGTLGGVHLVAGEAEQVHILERTLRAEVEGQFACALHGIGVEERTGSVRDGSQLGDGLDHAGLVVGEHDGDELRIRTNGGDEGRPAR